MKIWIVVLFIGLGLFANAQEVEHEGVKYEIKGNAIFKEGKDVTTTLSAEKQSDIRAVFEQSKIAIREAETAAKQAIIAQKEADKAASKLAKEQKEADKALKKAEKAQNNAEKAQKKAEKDLKNVKKAQDEFARATKRLQKNQDKYDRLKRKGKLSPNDDRNWLRKLEGHRKAVEKYQSKMNKS